jgi:excinuclease UvrABC nuclease subunit
LIKEEVSANADGGFEWKQKKLKPLLHLAENFLDSYIISQSLQEESTMINDMFTTLQARYELKNVPYRIECIDISHLSG